MLGPMENAAVDPLLLSEVSPAGHLNVDEMLRSLMDINIVEETSVTEGVPTSPANTVDKLGAHTSSTSPSSPDNLAYLSSLKIVH